jgi:glycosyltransferase involved in cell wall biosynthesis
MSGRVAIIIPVFDGETILPRAIECARSQNLGNHEIVVVDDGSRDRTADVARALSVTLFRQANAGPAAARNRGLRESSSEYVAFLDADDEWPVGSIDYLVSRLEVEPDLDVALGQVQCFVPSDAGRHEKHGPPFVTFLLGAAVYRRSVFDRVGCLDESLRDGEDVDWFMRARELGVSLRVYPRTTLHYRRRAGSITFGRGEEARTLARMLKRSIDRRSRTAPSSPTELPALARAGPTPSAAVSAIVVVRNGERFLGEALDSIVHGTVAPREIVLVDGGSVDATPEIAKRYPSLRIVSQSGQGIADAYNEGIRSARFDTLAFLSHDDRWSARKLERQLAHLDAVPACDAVVARVQHFLERGECAPAGFRQTLLAEKPAAFIMETLVARRRVFDRVGGFDASYTVAEDVDWFARARDEGVRIDVVDDALVFKRVHGGNASLHALENDALLLRAARASILRKRALMPG